MANQQLPPRVIVAIGEYLRYRRKCGPVSVAKLTRATRSVTSELTMSDNELSDLIARELMHAGVAIDFDMQDATARQIGETHRTV